jgi:hypothetical protein
VALAVAVVVLDQLVVMCVVVVRHLAAEAEAHTLLVVAVKAAHQPTLEVVAVVEAVAVQLAQAVRLLF